MALEITDYLPVPDKIKQSRILDARERLATIIAAWLPQLDIRPNSVFGDIILTPDAILLAAIEEAVARFASDLNLNNVANGVIYNADFVTQYLENFGVSARDTVKASGIIRLTFTTNKTYVIDADTVFSFGAGDFKINADEGSPVVIFPVGSTDGKRVLVKTGNDRYVVHLPVNGTPGATVQDGATAVHNLTHEELTSVNAAGDFDPGLQEESLADLALKAQDVFASANLTSRSGTLSFLFRKWPQMLGASVVLTGDREMLRDGANILGIAEGVADIYIRSQARYVFGELTATLTYNDNLSGWVGLLPFPTVPAFFDLKSGVFQVNRFLNNRGVNTVYSKSNDLLIDNLGVAYSNKEAIGILIDDTNPADFQAAFNDVVTTIVSDGTQMVLAGEYAGYVFSADPTRNITLRFDAVTTIEGNEAVLANVRDEVSGDTAVVYFVPASATDSSFGVIYKDLGYKIMFNGLEISVAQPGGSFVPADLVGQAFSFHFKGRTADFTVNYLYDPMLIQVDSVVQNQDNRPVGTSLLVKSFIQCYVYEFIVHYRASFGSTIDLTTARNQIFAYMNSIIYPEVYEESKIGTILIKNGAAGLQSITKKGTFYPSLGSKFVQQDGTEINVPRLHTVTLIPPVNDLGFGVRNVTYILDSESIKFNSIVV